jgi:hypothetical protein
MNIRRPIVGGAMTIESAHNKALQLTARSLASVVSVEADHSIARCVAIRTIPPRRTVMVLRGWRAPVKSGVAEPRRVRGGSGC